MPDYWFPLGNRHPIDPSLSPYEREINPSERKVSIVKWYYHLRSGHKHPNQCSQQVIQHPAAHKTCVFWSEYVDKVHHEGWCMGVANQCTATSHHTCSWKLPTAWQYVLSASQGGMFLGIVTRYVWSWTVHNPVTTLTHSTILQQGPCPGFQNPTHTPATINTPHDIWICQCSIMRPETCTPWLTRPIAHEDGKKWSSANSA